MLRLMAVAATTLVVGCLHLSRYLSSSSSSSSSLSSSSSSSSLRVTTTTTQSSGHIFSPLLSSWTTTNDREVRGDPKGLLLSGTFDFRYTQACATLNAAVRPCQVHFPSQAETDWNFSACLDKDSFCLLTQKGHKPLLLGEQEVEESLTADYPNQDRSLLLQPLAIRNPYTQTVDSDCMLLFLADGHGPGGHLTATEVQQDLPFRILRLLEQKPQQQQQQQRDVPAVLNQAFLECDHHILAMTASIQHSGATTVVVLKIDSIIYIASLGDSTVALIQWNSDNSGNNNNNKPFQIVAKATPHKPHMPEERSRIERLHGQVYIPDSLQHESSRVFLPGGSALAMSRSFGDISGKTPGWLLAEPTILTVPLQRDCDYFVLVASDGVTDYHPFETVVQKAGRALFPSKRDSNNNNNHKQSLGNALEQILRESADGWFRMTNGEYRDDMTLAITRIAAAV